MKSPSQLVAGLALPLVLFVSAAFGQASYRVAPAYEDTVRIVILVNTNATGGSYCPSGTNPVGVLTGDFVVRALDTTKVTNVKVFATQSTPWSTIENAWGGDSLPHAIVHVNAGWHSMNGPYLSDVMRNAVQRYIGVVSLGDDAAHLATDVFGFRNVQNIPPEIGDARFLDDPDDSLWIGLKPGSDTLTDPSKYPYLNGIISNASDSILRDSTVYFKPYGPDGRCQADADAYGLDPSYIRKLTFLGSMFGSNGGARIGRVDQFQVVVALQDTIRIGANTIVRRGVALSFQPQFLQHKAASEQVVYDAIMYASLAHSLRKADKLLLQVSSSTMKAGDTVDITGQVLDEKDSVIAGLGDSIQWKIDPATVKPGDVLIGDKGTRIRFTGTQAYHTVGVIATFVDPKTGVTLIDTAQIAIIPNDPYRVVAEQSSDFALTQAQVVGAIDSVAAHPLPLVAMDSTQNQKFAYAVVRDIYGNFIRLASGATWRSVNEGIAVAREQSGKQYEGLITRVTTGNTNAIVNDIGVPVADTLPIQIRAGVIIALRLIDTRNPGVALDTIKMNTDQKMTIKVEGKWSNAPDDWVDVTGLWSMSPDTLRSEKSLPTAEAGSWEYSPINPGSANLTVDAGTRDITVPVRITPAPPSKVFLQIVTPADSLIAGRPIKIAVRIENTDGVVPGPWCGSSVYRDTLDNTARLPAPSLTIDGAQGSLGVATNECFSNGYDTISVTLYYAPYNYQDSLHRISLNLGAIPRAYTDPFRLLPGPIDSLQLEYEDGKPVEETVYLQYPDGFIVMYSVSYDQFGNKRGYELSNWSVDGNLHQPASPQDFRMFYESQTVVYSEAGAMCASAVAGPLFKDCVRIEIVGQGAQLIESVTRDLSGNGLLDRFDFEFNKKVAIAPNFAGVKIYYGSTTWHIDSIKPVSGALPDSLYYVYVTEARYSVSGKLQSQSWWKPYVDISGLADANTVTRKPCVDGAQPVVWRVVKTIRSGDRKEDVVEVYMSEKISGSDGNQFSILKTPADVFMVWRDSDTIGGRTQEPSALAGIKTFRNVNGDSVMVFAMENGYDLTTANWVNIRDDQRPLHDKSGNFPLSSNQLVRVEVKGQKVIMQVFPNPSPPTFRRMAAGQFNLNHKPEARRWVRDDRAGTVVSVRVTIPPTGGVKAYAKIYDLAGNLVNSASTDDITDSIPDKNVSMYDVDIYWNGSNSRGMAVAPGIYRIVVYLDYDAGTQYKDEKLYAIVGVGR